ncbi:MAG: hypothetical protein IJ092_04195 [Atopobiaceae bacterium]|nr:hypothetical protein [Atopobiaceae bacterium]
MTTSKSSTAEHIRSASWESITYTREELAKTVEDIEDDAVKDAASRLWESVKGEMEQHWEKVKELRGYGVAQGEKAAKRADKAMVRRLDAFKVAFRAMDCELDVTIDWYDGSIFQLGLSRDNYCMGCIREYTN